MAQGAGRRPDTERIAFTALFVCWPCLLFHHQLEVRLVSSHRLARLAPLWLGAFSI